MSTTGRLFNKLQVVKLSSNFREATKLVQVPIPKPEAGSVLIKNLYAGVNASDVNISAGRYWTDGNLPFDVGFEGLGSIEEVGSDVTLQKDQAVLFWRSGSGAYSGYALADAKSVLPVPDVKPEYLLSLACGLTAAIGLEEAGRIKSGEKVLITAAAGGTGHIAVQWAKKAGCFVIGTTSSDEKAAFLKQLGCDHVINYKHEDLGTVLKTQYPDGIDVIWETIGGNVFETLVNRLAIGGRLLLIGGIKGYTTDSKSGMPPADLSNLPAKLLMKSQSLVGFNMLNARHLIPKYWPRLIEGIRSKDLITKVDLGETSPGGPFTGVQDAVRAVEYLHSGMNQGKVVVKIA